MNNQDPGQEVDVKDDDNDHGNSKEPVAVTLVHPTMIVLRIKRRNYNNNKISENRKIDRISNVVHLINCPINCVG